jgi:hypothetical protein
MEISWMIPLLEALGKLGLGHLSIIVFGVLVAVFVFNSQNQLKRFVEISRINERTFAQWLDYVDGLLVQIANVSIDRARVIIDEAYLIDTNICSHCKSPLHIPEPDAQIGYFSVRLRETLLTGVVKNKLKLAYRQNGFLEMSKEDYRQYLVDKSHALLNETRSELNESNLFYPYLIGTDEKRFTQKDTFPFVEKIFDKARQLKEEKAKLEKEVYKKTSILFFLNKIKIKIGDSK